MDLVTGGAGFLGLELARQLLERGREVRILDRVQSPRLPPEAEFRKGDIRDLAAVSRACEGAEVVYHLVGVVPQARVRPDEMRAINVGGTRNVLNACFEKGASRMVFVSSSEVYGRLEAVPCTETAILGPIGEYGVNKMSAELMCREAMRERGLPVSILRPTTIVGPHNWDGMFEMLFKQVMDNGYLPVPGRGDAKWQVVHVEDTAAAAVLAGESEEAAGQAFNVAAPGEVPTHLELALAMKKSTGSSARIIRINKTLTTGVLRALCLLGLSPLEPDQFLVGFSDYVLDVSKLQSMLGWEAKFTSLEAFEASYRWYESTLS